MLFIFFVLLGGLGYKAPRLRPLPSKERAKAQRSPILHTSCQYDTPPLPPTVSVYDIIYIKRTKVCASQGAKSKNTVPIHYKTLAPCSTLRSVQYDLGSHFFAEKSWEQ